MPPLAPLTQRKKTKILIPILIIIVLIALINISRSYFFGKPKTVVPPPAVSQKKVEIDYGVLKNPILGGLTAFDQVPSLAEEPGRLNPFEPY